MDLNINELSLWENSWNHLGCADNIVSTVNSALESHFSLYLKIYVSKENILGAIYNL